MAEARGQAPEGERWVGPALRGALEDLLDLVFPPLCPLCEAPGDERGLGCAEHRLPLRPSGPRCGRCAARLPPMIPSGERCAACRERAPGFARLVALADYREDGPAREWILALKHGRRTALADVLGRVLGARLCDELDLDPARPAPVLVPVPLHRWRRLERGFDQAALLARAAGRVAGLAVVPALRRVRATSPQGAPGSGSREANVRAAFRARRSCARRVAGRPVWLVDDVVTSGATASECARELARAGAAEVGVACVARAG